MNALQKRALPKSLNLVDRGGTFVRRVSRDESCALVSRGGAVLRDNKVVQLIAPDTREYGGGHERRTRYSHNRESASNPRGVWELTAILHHPPEFYTGVLDECLPQAA